MSSTRRMARESLPGDALRPELRRASLFAHASAPAAADVRDDQADARDLRADERGRDADRLAFLNHEPYPAPPPGALLRRPRPF